MGAPSPARGSRFGQGEGGPPNVLLTGMFFSEVLSTGPGPGDDPSGPTPRTGGRFRRFLLSPKTGGIVRAVNTSERVPVYSVASLWARKLSGPRIRALPGSGPFRQGGRPAPAHRTAICPTLRFSASAPRDRMFYGGIASRRTPGHGSSSRESIGQLGRGHLGASPSRPEPLQTEFAAPWTPGGARTGCGRRCATPMRDGGPAHPPAQGNVLGSRSGNDRRLVVGSLLLFEADRRRVRRRREGGPQRRGRFAPPRPASLGFRGPVPQAGAGRAEGPILGRNRPFIEAEGQGAIVGGGPGKKKLAEDPAGGDGGKRATLRSGDRAFFGDQEKKSKFGAGTIPDRECPATEKNRASRLHPTGPACQPWGLNPEVLRNRAARVRSQMKHRGRPNFVFRPGFLFSASWTVGAPRKGGSSQAQVFSGSMDWKRRQKAGRRAKALTDFGVRRAHSQRRPGKFGGAGGREKGPVRVFAGIRPGSAQALHEAGGRGQPGGAWDPLWGGNWFGQSKAGVATPTRNGK